MFLGMYNCLIYYYNINLSQTSTSVSECFWILDAFNGVGVTPLLDSRLCGGNLYSFCPIYSCLLYYIYNKGDVVRVTPSYRTDNMQTELTDAQFLEWYWTMGWIIH